jgi:TnpA family transposase
VPTDEVLTTSQRQQLQNVVRNLSSDDIIRYYTFLASDLRIITKRKRKTRFGFAIQLCYLRFPGRSLEAEEYVPDQVQLYIGKQLNLPTRLLRAYGQKRDQTSDDHNQDLRRAFGFLEFSDVIERELTEWLLSTALDIDDGLMLITTLMEEMRTRQVIQPALSRLEALVWHVREDAKQTLFQRLTGQITTRQREQILQLLEVRKEPPLVSHLVWLREPPREAKPINFQRIADRLDFIRTIGLPQAVGQAIPYHRLQQLAGQGERFTPQHLSGLQDNGECLAILIAFLHNKTAALTDQALRMHDELVRNMFNSSEKQQQRKLRKDAKQVNRIVYLHGKIGQSIIQARTSGMDSYAAIEQVIAWSEYAQSVEDAGTLSQGENLETLDLVDKRYKGIRRYSPRLLEVFEFSGSEASASLRAGIDLMKQRNQKDQPGDIPSDAPTGFVPKRWDPYVTDKEGRIDHHYYELCLLTELRNSLRSGAITVKHSEQFKDFDEYLLPLSVWQHMQEMKTVPLPIELDFPTYLRQRQQQLTSELEWVNTLVEKNALPGVTVKNGKFSFVRPKQAEHVAAAESLSEALYDLVPRIRLPELLAEVDAWTGFSRCFTHQRTGQQVDNPAELYAVILAEGVNLGLTKMADISPTLKPESLLTVSNWYIREETYEQALVELVNFHHQLPFSEYWGDGSTSASDAQFFLADKRVPLAGINKHYGFQPGVLFYTHQSEQYGSYQITVLSPLEHQAPAMVDGLLRNQTDLDIREHYTDTGGFSDDGFALFHLLGIGYAPRMRDFNEKRLFCFEDPDHYPALKPWIGGKINSKKVEPHWDEILRMMSSIKLGTVTASLAMKRLAAYERKNGMATALNELGHIERSLFMLRWLQDPVLRYRTFVGLEKIERKHTMADALFIYRHGTVKDRSVEDVLNRATGLNLLIMAIVVWNTKYLAYAIQVLQQRGIQITEELLPHISPLAWDHVNLTGDYIWEKLLPKILTALRPLREQKIATRFPKK